MESAGQHIEGILFHVFLSHSSADKSAVEQLALWLRDRAGLNPFLDKWHLVPGAPWQPALEQALAESETVAVFFGPSGPGPWHNEELQLALVRAVQQRNDFRVIPVLLPGASPQQIGGFLGLRTWIDFREGLDSEAAFSRLVAGIQGYAPAADAFRLPDEPTPYRGLLAFDEAHSEYFFGRQADIECTLEKLGRERFVAVVGPSGCGKSSLVLGGVLPAVKRPGGALGPGVRTWTMRPGDRPVRALADALAAGEASGAQRLSLSDALHRRFLEHADGLRTALATLTADSPGSCILVVDQLEELFTHAPGHAGAGEAEPFVTQLRDAVQGSGSLRILATLRADFFDRCLGLAPLRELLQDRTVLLGSLGDEALRDVILRPAQSVGAYLEKGLLSAILQDVSREPGALPLLEDALDQLWRARRGAWLTLSAYEASGGISQALQRRAQACYEALPPEEREVARLLLVRLTSLGEGREDTRRRVPRSELVFPGIPEARVEHVLRVLSGSGARLIVMDQGSVEVAHEVLIRTWSTLRKWLDEDRRELRVQRRLAEAADEWNGKRRQPGYLYTGARLLDAEELFRHKPALINQLERELLEASIQQRDLHRREEEAQARRELEAARRLAEETEARRKVEADGAAKARRSAGYLRNLAVGLAVAIIAVIAGSFLLYRQFRVAFSRELVLSARQGLREDPQRSLLLLQEAQRLAPVDNFGAHLEAWSQEPCLLVLREHPGRITDAAFSPDGKRVLTTSSGGTARLWEATTGKTLAILQGTSIAVSSAMFSRDGSRVLTASADGTARLWEADSGKLLATLQGHSKTGLSATFSPDGTRVLTASADGTARLWEAATGKSLVIFQGHSQAVWLAAFSPDGTRVLTSSADGTARLWEASSGKALATLQGHSGALLLTTFSPDGSRVLIASSDGTARLWDVSTGEAQAALQGHSEAVSSAMFSPDGARVLTASEDGTARLWEAASGKPLVTFQGHSEEVMSAAFSLDGTRVLTASSDGTARLWEAATGKALAILQGTSKAMGSATFSPDGTRVLTASADGTARLWEVATGKLLMTLQGHSQAVWLATFSPDGTRVLTASADGTARVWEGFPGKALAILRGHSDAVLSAAFSPDGKHVLTASRDSTARLWEAASGRPLVTFQGHSKAVRSATFSSDGTRVLTTAYDGTARLWEASSAKPLATLQGHSEEVLSATFSPDGARVLTVSADGSARLWDSAGQPLSILQGHSKAVVFAAFSRDGARVLTASKDGTVRLWEAASGKALASFQGHSDALFSATFSPDGTRALTASRDGTARLWKVGSDKSLVTFQGHSKAVRSATFSPDGTRVLTASEDSTARLWEASSGKPLAILPGHSEEVLSALFSPDGTRVRTVSADRSVRLWDSAGRLVATLQGHSDSVWSVTFSRDGTRLLTASRDGTARLWEVSSGKALATLQGHSGDLFSVTFSPDGARALTASEDGTARLWPNWRWDPEAFEKHDVGRTLTCKERRMFLHEDIVCTEELAPQGSEQPQ